MKEQSLIDSYIAEIKAESVSTRKCLERISPEHYKFKPHPTSMEMGYLTMLVAEIPGWIKAMVEDSVIDFETFKHIEQTDTTGLVKQYDALVDGAINALSNITEKSLATKFELKNKGVLLYAQPKLQGVGETINHWIHHRGQLTVYMRISEIPVPSIYGPSADDKNF